MEKASKGSQYKVVQLYGYKGSNKKILEEDVILVVKFDSIGKYLELGDRVDRVIIFKAVDDKKKE